MKYTVTATLQSEGNDPVEMRWVTKGTEVQAMISVGQLLDEKMFAPKDGYSAKLLGIHVTPVPDPTPPWEEQS